MSINRKYQFRWLIFNIIDITPVLNKLRIFWMRRLNNIYIWSLIVVIILNLFLINRQNTLHGQIRQKDNIVSNYRQNIAINIVNLGRRLDINKLNNNSVCRLLYRYTDSCCFDCVQEGLILLENTFKEKLNKELLIIGSYNFNKHLEIYSKIDWPNSFTELDKLKLPYVCFVNSDGVVLFSLLLKPENYEENKIILEACLNYFD
jgi:hypothetical protein